MIYTCVQNFRAYLEKSMRKLCGPHLFGSSVNSGLWPKVTTNPLAFVRIRYLGALKFMLDPNSKSIFETETIDPTIVNKRKRTALMLCFTSPHFTIIAKDFGLEQDPETGLAIPCAKRPDTAQVIETGFSVPRS